MQSGATEWDSVLLEVFLEGRPEQVQKQHRANHAPSTSSFRPHLVTYRIPHLAETQTANAEPPTTTRMNSQPKGLTPPDWLKGFHFPAFQFSIGSSAVQQKPKLAIKLQRLHVS